MYYGGGGGVVIAKDKMEYFTIFDIDAMWTEM